MSEACAALTTIRYEQSLIRCQHNSSPIYLLDWHFKRLQETYASLQASSRTISRPFPFQDPQDLHNRVDQAVTEWKAKQRDVIDDDVALRIRLTAGIHGAIHLTIAITGAVPPSQLFPTTLTRTLDPPFGAPFTVFLDKESTPISIRTAFKTTDRAIYDNARRRARMLDDLSARGKEVLLHNDRGQIMDGSITTPYFWRNEEWITPSPESGGLRGATRYMALDRRLCREGVVLRESICHGERIWLSNAVRGFFCGIVVVEEARRTDGR